MRCNTQKYPFQLTWNLIVQKNQNTNKKYLRPFANENGNNKAFIFHSNGDPIATTSRPLAQKDSAVKSQNINKTLCHWLAAHCLILLNYADQF